MIAVGEKFPDFTLPDQKGAQHTLSQTAGKWRVFYFYPKDNTSGCTLEAQNFATSIAVFTQNAVEVIGVSPDSVKSHCGFAEKYALPFTLLSDEDHTLLTACGVWQTKKMYGKEYMGVVRTTVLVNPQGVVSFVWEKVKVPGHIEAVLDKIKELV